MEAPDFGIAIILGALIAVVAVDERVNTLHRARADVVGARAAVVAAHRCMRATVLGTAPVIGARVSVVAIALGVNAPRRRTA